MRPCSSQPQHGWLKQACGKKSKQASRWTGKEVSSGPGLFVLHWVSEAYPSKVAAEVHNDRGPKAESSGYSEAQHGSKNAVSQETAIRRWDRSTQQGQLAHEVPRVQDEHGQQAAEGNQAGDARSC